MNKAEVLAKVLPDVTDVVASAEHFAPSNIALCKYWGKRDAELNLPINPSLSISLRDLGTHTKVTPLDQPVDRVILNGHEMHPETKFAQRISRFIDLFRRDSAIGFLVETRNNIPTQAGLASSASGFAALTLALNDSFGFNLSKEALSMIARMGSGSASRSIYQGFVEWHMGHREDGLDSHAHPIDIQWPGLAVGLIKIDVGEKSIDSRSGMQRTIETSHLYNSWPAQANADLAKLHEALNSHNFELLASTAEHNAMSMHATFASSWPPLVYWLPDSLAAMHKVWQLRQQGLALYFTMDAGPNLKLLFEKSSLNDVVSHFPEMELVLPFGE